MAQGKPDPNEQRRELFRLSGLGLEFGSSVIGGVLLGYLLDRWLGTGPWLLLVGTGIGFAAGLFRMVRLLNRSRKKKPPSL